MTAPTPSAEWETAEPLTVAGHLPAGYELCRPMPVRVWREGSGYVAASVDFDLHAFGGSVDEALDALGERVIAHLKRLDELDDKLSPRLAAERETLRALIAVHA